jgi:hypothetical protein
VRHEGAAGTPAAAARWLAAQILDVWRRPGRGRGRIARARLAAAPVAARCVAIGTRFKATHEFGAVVPRRRFRARAEGGHRRERRRRHAYDEITDDACVAEWPQSRDAKGQPLHGGVVRPARELRSAVATAAASAHSPDRIWARLDADPATALNWRRSPGMAGRRRRCGRRDDCRARGRGAAAPRAT